MRALPALLASLFLIPAAGAGAADPPVPRPRYDLVPRFERALELTAEYDEQNELPRSSLSLPTVMATGDFDEDGTLDLLCAYTVGGRAFLVLRRGNVDAIFQHAPAAVDRRRSGLFIDQPFLRAVRLSALPEIPDFMETGDFDADGHRDLVIAAHGGEALHFLRGDGQGGLATSRRVEIGGGITAMIAGEIDRPDGLADLVVAVDRPAGAALMIFSTRDGALRDIAERIEIPAPVFALTLGELDDHPAIDLIAAANTELLVIRGADRRPSAGGRVLLRFDFRESIEDVVFADFVWDLDHRDELTVLTSNGSLFNVSLRQLEALSDRGVPLTAATDLGPSPAGRRRRLLPVRATGRPADELLILDGESSMTLLAHRPSGEPPSRADAWPTTIATGLVELPAEPVAVRAMRLNGDALSDLVVLGRGVTEPLAVLSSVAALFTVDSAGDESDIIRDGVCATDPGTCTLRAAIQEANFLPGADTIVFALPAGSLTIAPTWALPPVSEAVAIDATTQPGFAGTPIVELDGGSAGSWISGLLLTGGNITVRGLAIGNYASDGIGMLGNGNNIVEGNFIGTDRTGTTSRPNAVIGVSSSTVDNTVGGTVVAARNVISGNEIYGVWLDSIGSRNTVAGNFIGTDVSGTIAVANSVGGVLLTDTDLNLVGTPDPGGHNVISGNPLGVVIGSGSAGLNLVQHNYIGTDFSGSSPLPNAGSGVTLSGSGDTVTRNIISHNLAAGVSVTGATATGNTIRDNSIFSNIGLGIDLGSPGVSLNDPVDHDAGENDLQNYPELIVAGTTGTRVAIRGTMNGPPTTDLLLEFFTGSACDPSGYGEGETALGTTPVTTDAMGDATFNSAFTATVPVGQTVTATATNPDRSTSEFSACLTVEDCQSLAWVFGQTILAPDRNTLGWPVADDISFVKGDLALVASYAIGGQGLLPVATSLDISSDAPGPGTGLYYLVKPEQLCGGWQTAPGAEPDRDTTLP